MVKIIHTADIHLDSPFSLLDVQKAQMRKNELRETFSSIVKLAESEKADIMMIANLTIAEKVSLSSFFLI